MPEPSQYPIFLDLVQCPVLIVGGGAVGLRKAGELLQARARVTVVSLKFVDGFGELKGIDRITGAYVATHLSMKMWRLVFAATNDREVNDLVQKHCAVHGILCCRCDEPELGDFSGGATWVSEGGQVCLAVATEGASPVLAARLRDAAAQAVDPVLVTWVALMGPWRKRAKHEVKNAAARRELFTRMAGPEMEERLRKQGSEAATALFNEWLGQLRSGDPHTGASRQGVQT